MAHNIELGANGKHSFVSGNNQKAWHGLGQVLAQKFLTSKECIEHANLGYTVEKTPAYSLINGKFVSIPNTFNTFRSDTNTPFSGTVGKGYTVVQNTEAFTFFDNIVGQDLAIYETAGVLGVGESIFLTAKLPDYCTIKGEKIEYFIILKMSHDGKGPIKAMITPIRVVCQNTLNMAIENAVNCLNIRHTISAPERLKQAHKLMGITNEYKEAFTNMAEKLMKVKISDKMFKDIIVDLFPSGAKERSENTRIKNILNDVENSYYTGVGQSGIIGNGWGVYNGVGHYFDHIKKYGNPEKDAIASQEIKFDNLFSGLAYTVKNDLVDKLLTLA